MSAVAPHRNATLDTFAASRAKPRANPVWARSAAAFGGGWLVTATLMINLAWLPGVSLAAALLLVLLLAFPVWVGVAYYCYAARSQLAAWRTLALVALPSLALNALLYAG